MSSRAHHPTLPRAVLEQAARAGSMPGTPATKVPDAIVDSCALAARQDVPGQYTLDLTRAAAASTDVPADAELVVLVVDYSVDQSAMEQVEQLVVSRASADQQPGQGITFVIADLARPSLSEISSIIDSVGTRESALLKRYTDHISALALNSNCYIQLSVADAQAKGTDTDDALRVYLTIIFEAFGSRMLFADCHQPQWAQTCTRILSSIGAQQDDLECIFEKNASKIFKQ